MATPLKDQLLDQDKQKGYVCNVGSYCSPQMITPTVPSGSGKNDTKITHRTTTTITDGKATTDVYIFKQDTILGLPVNQGKWVKAGTTTDGGNTFTFNEEKDANGNPLIGAGVRQSLAPNGDMNKNVKAQITRTLKGANEQQAASTPNLTDQQIKQSGAVDSNTATEGETAETIGAESFNQGQVQQQIGEAKYLRKNYGDDNRYPLDMKGDQDHIKFTMYAYAPKKFGLTEGLGAFTGTNIAPGGKLGTVILPIQPQISDSNPVSWGEDTMNSLDAAAAAAAYAAITQGGEGLAKTAETIAKEIGDQQGNITSALAAKLSGAAAGVNKNFLSRVTGGVLNNNVELLFQGPSLRTFTFSFLMSAREQKETEMIVKIIRFFKQGMSVKTTGANLFLKAPNIFTIEYIHKNEPHRYINKIKTCALQNCTVNYTPEGNYSTYTDGSMTQYSLTLTFGEIDPIYEDDYKGLNDIEIGY